MKSSRQILIQMAGKNKKALPISLLAFSVIAILSAIAIINIKAFVLSVIFIAGIGAFSIFENRNWKIRQGKLAEKRGALNIGDFSKEFNVRDISPIAIRYTFDRLIGMEITANALPSDDLLQMYRIDSDELDDIVLDFIDQFSINSLALETYEKRKIETIFDLVKLIDQIYKHYVENQTKPSAMQNE